MTGDILLLSEICSKSFHCNAYFNAVSYPYVIMILISTFLADTDLKAASSAQDKAGQEPKRQSYIPESALNIKKPKLMLQLIKSLDQK